MEIDTVKAEATTRRGLLRQPLKSTINLETWH